MAQDQAESTKEPINHGKFINKEIQPGWLQEKED